MSDQRYRPDLCEPQNTDGEPQADLCGTSDTQWTKKSPAEWRHALAEAMKERKQAVIRNAGKMKPRRIDEPDDELDRLRAENETLRKQGSVYNGKSAEEWYTLYCQSVLGSDSVSGDTRDADVMRDDLPEYLL